jgi:Calcineurin-like phosphoesterase
MRRNTAIVTALLVVAAAAAAVVLAEEKIEHIVAPETGELRPPEGEWISSVPGTTARVWAVGDANPPESNRVVNLIRRADPDRILYLGDVYPNGTRDDFDRWAKPWGRLVNRMAPTPGNHEWPEAREGYEPFWREVTGETPPTYYAFRAGGWDVLSVNGEHSEWRSVENWLIDKTSGGGNCRIVFWHRPAYSAGKYEDGDGKAREFWEAIRGRARIVVNGHDHDMQRLKPRDGIVQFISGAGGQEQYKVDEDDPDLAFGDDDHFGALRLRLSDERAKWRFVTPRGRVLDSGSLGCRA